MAFVIGPECIDVMDKSCLEECPVDCIYEGDRKLYIHPVECIDCGACESACPVEAISIDDDAEEDGPRKQFADDNAQFFDQTLPGRDTPVGAPGGAEMTGRIGVDTPLVANHQAGT